MARRLCQFLLTLAVLYGLAVGAFAYLHYGSNPRPDVVTIASDMHEWVRARFQSAPAPAGEPGAVPVRREEPPTVVPAVGPTPPAPPAPPIVPSDPRDQAVAKVRDVILPKAEAEMRQLDDRGVKDLAGAKARARATLVEARDLLGPILDANAADREVQKLYKRVMDLLIAVDKR